MLAIGAKHRSNYPFSVLQVPGLMHALTAVRLLTLKETMVKTYCILMSFTLSRLRLGHETLTFRCAYTTNAQGNQEEEMKVVFLVIVKRRRATAATRRVWSSSSSSGMACHRN